MPSWCADAAVIVAAVVLVAIRAPHGQRSRSVAVAKDLQGRVESALLVVAWAGFFVPFVWMATSLLDFADYPLEPPAFAAGVVCYAAGLWIFHRSHADLGTNWSITLAVREGHTLVTGGVYRTIRHPMYTGLLLFSVGQALVLPNWIAGPAYLVTMALIVACRLGPEERMMRDEFGAEYDAYVGRTKRLIPGVW